MIPTSEDGNYLGYYPGEPGYYPGDVSFDPLALKPRDAGEFRLMQERELAHGRLAMLAAAGFFAQEAVVIRTRRFALQKGQPVSEKIKYLVE